ncbi:MAG: SEC-C metal-binding domain-containing protein [Thermoguttaceae bacterium]
MVRLSEAKIKQAIVNPDPMIRERAVRYFSVCYSDDEEVVPLVIQAIEKYGREDAYNLIGPSIHLRHSDKTIAWVVDELNDPDSDRYESYTFNLTRVLCHADPALLVHRDTAIIESRHFLPSFRERLTRRLELLSWDEAECWRCLEEICEEGKGKQFTNEVDLSFANDLLEAMARAGCIHEDRVVSILTQKVDDFENNPMKWLEPLMVDFAGLLRLEAAVPLIVGKLHEDADFLSENCVRALSHIGTDAVVTVVADDFADAEQHFRLYASNVLENVHSDLAVEKAVALLEREGDEQVRRDLAHAALSHFAREAIEPVRQLIRSQRLDGDLRHLRDLLVQTCTIMEERFPEYDEWRAAGKREREEHRRQLEAVADDPRATLLWTLERAKDYFLPNEAGKKTPVASVDKLLRGGSFKPVAGRVGRNAPCPCGSGKKYKNCCMKKSP